MRYNAAVDLVDRNLAAGRGAKTAFLHDRGATTYAELAALVAAASSLFSAVVAGEQRVAICLPDAIELPVAFLGAMRAGAVPVLLNTLLRAEDYAFMIADSRAVALVVHADLLPRFADAIAASPALKHVYVVGADTEHRRFEDELAASTTITPPADTTTEDVAFWLYSSGSTGLPKGTMHRHHSLIETADRYARGVLGMRESDIVYSAAKLFFAYGLGNALTFPMAVGATAVLRAARPTAELVVATLQQSGATIFGGVPTLFASLLAHAEANDVTHLGALRVCTSAGESLPEDVGTRFYERFGAHILDGLGSTEMLHIFLSSQPGHVRYGCTGVAVPGYELKLVGEDGDEVATGELGELWVKGPTAATGYWNRREKSLDTFVGAWTRTGDKFVRDADGSYRCAGRTDDMMKVSGLWVSPVEVEAALGSHGLVLEAAVVGALDADGLLKPMAYVVLRDPSVATIELEAELKRWVKDRLVPHKYPRRIHFVDALPKTATGKIQRFKLRGGS